MVVAPVAGRGQYSRSLDELASPGKAWKEMDGMMQSNIDMIRAAAGRLEAQCAAHALC